MRVVVNRSRCRGVGMCEEAAPEIFEISDDGTMKVLDEHPCAELRALVEKAVKGCPMAALSLAED